MIVSHRGGNALKPDNDPDFFFKGKQGQLSAALGLCPEYRSGYPVVHFLRKISLPRGL